MSNRKDTQKGKNDMVQTEAKPTMSVDEAAALAGIGLNQMYTAVREGTIPSLRIGRRILIPRKKFMALLNGDDEA